MSHQSERTRAFGIIAVRCRGVLMCPECMTDEEVNLTSLFYNDRNCPEGAQCERCGDVLSSSA